MCLADAVFVWSPHVQRRARCVGLDHMGSSSTEGSTTAFAGNIPPKMQYVSDVEGHYCPANGNFHSHISRKASTAVDFVQSRKAASNVCSGLAGIQTGGAAEWSAGGGRRGTAGLPSGVVASASGAAEPAGMVSSSGWRAGLGILEGALRAGRAVSG